MFYFVLYVFSGFLGFCFKSWLVYSSTSSISAFSILSSSFRQFILSGIILLIWLWYSNASLRGILLSSFGCFSAGFNASGKHFSRAL